MQKKSVSLWRSLLNIVMMGGVLTSLGACSSDSTRFSDPFSNPFARADNQNPHYGTVGNTNQPVYASSAPVAPVQSRPLPPSTAYATAPYATAPVPAQQTAPVVQTFQPPARQAYNNQSYGAPLHQSTIAYNQPVASNTQQYAQPQYQAQPTASPRYGYAAPTGNQNFATGSIRPAPNVTPSAPAPITGFGNGWHAEGGTPIIVGQNETLRMISSRYGVPDEAIMSVNGLSSPLQVQPGMRIIIPIYDNPQKSGQLPSQNQSVARQPQQQVQQQAYALPNANRVAKAPQNLAPQSQQLAYNYGAQNTRSQTQTALQSAPQSAGQANRSKSQFIDAMSSAAVVETPKPVNKTVAPLQPKTPLKAQLAQVNTLQPVKPTQALPAQTAPQQKQFTQTAGLQSQPAPVPALASASASASAQFQPASISAQQSASLKSSHANPVLSDPTPTSSLETTASDDAGAAQFRWPARGHIIQGFSQNNDGINIAVPEGTAVKAVEGGVVAYAGSELKGYGNLVLVRHPNGFVSAYANNGEIDVKRGDTVKRGQIIAKSGQSGDVSSPQLHFELRKGSKPVDPMPYLAGT